MTSTPLVRLLFDAFRMRRTGYLHAAVEWTSSTYRTDYQTPSKALLNPQPPSEVVRALPGPDKQDLDVYRALPSTANVFLLALQLSLFV